MMRRLLLVVGVCLLVSACAQSQPLVLKSFNAKLLYVDSFATLVGQTCLDLSERERIKVELLVKCRNIVKQAGELVDAARANSDADRLAAANELLEKLEKELAEGK